MKIATSLKTLSLLGLTSLLLASAPSQAENGFVIYGGAPNANPWIGAAHNPNPWLNNPAMNHARFAAELRQRQAQLDQRQDRQMQRILNGMDSGKLTSREAAGLLREHLAIANMERSYMADGRLGPNELVSLEKRLEQAERQIQFEKNDRDQVAAYGRPADIGRPDIGRPDMGRPGDMGRPDNSGRPGDFGRR